MAGVTLTSNELFPVGTTVGVYARTPGVGAPSGAPLTASITTAVVSATQTLAFTGLTAGTPYWAAALVGGVWKYTAFVPDVAGDITINGALAQSGGNVGFYGVTPVARAGAITTPNAQTGAYVQADVTSLKTAIDAIRVALTNVGITA